MLHRPCSYFQPLRWDEQLMLHIYKFPSALSGHVFTLIHSNDHGMSDNNIVVINDETACTKTLPWQQTG
jgi:hypothetical protein